MLFKVSICEQISWFEGKQLFGYSYVKFLISVILILFIESAVSFKSFKFKENVYNRHWNDHHNNPPPLRVQRLSVELWLTSEALAGPHKKIQVKIGPLNELCGRFHEWHLVIKAIETFLKATR